MNTHNDLAGLTLVSIDLEDSGYDLTGDPVTLTGSLTSATGDNTYALATTLGGPVTLDDQGGDLTVQGAPSASPAASPSRATASSLSPAPTPPPATSRSNTDASVDVQGSLTVGPAATLDDWDALSVSAASSVPGGSLTVQGSAVVESVATFAMHGFDSGGDDLAQIGAGATFTVYGTADVGWTSTLHPSLGSATVASGGLFEMGETTYDGESPANFTVGSGGSMTIQKPAAALH